MAETFAGKSPEPREPLSPRDKAVCDGFLSGKTRPQLAEQHKVTRQRIGQILHLPAAVAYVAAQAGNTKSLVFAKAGEEILSRLDWGGVKMTDLIAIWRAAMPQEVTVNTPDLRTHAEQVAAELGLDADARARLIDYAAEKKQRRAG
jgi:hypothetical protein